MPLLAGYAAASIQDRIATGPRAGQPVRRLRTAAAVGDGAKLRCARREGFSLHANAALPAHAREQLEPLCRYLLRPPLGAGAIDGETCGGQTLYELPHPRREQLHPPAARSAGAGRKATSSSPRPGFTCCGSMASWPPRPLRAAVVPRSAGTPGLAGDRRQALRLPGPGAVPRPGPEDSPGRP